MWKLMHRLTRRDYIQWRNTADQGIARVWLDGMERACYWRYKSIRVAVVIAKPEDVIWLTCSPSKYMKDKP